MFRGVSTMFPMFCSPQLFSFLIVVVFHWKLVILFSNSRGRHCAIFVFCRTTSSFLFMERFSREVDPVNCLISSGGIFNQIISLRFSQKFLFEFLASKCLTPTRFDLADFGNVVNSIFRSLTIFLLIPYPFQIFCSQNFQ